MKMKEIIEQGNQSFLPNLSIDIVIIGYENNILKCLLLKMGEKWLLPGGYIKHDESVDIAAKNILKKRTGLTDAYLKFLSVFGDKDRQFKNAFKDFFEKRAMDWDEAYWFNNRFVTLAYFSLVNLKKIHPTISHFDDAFGWFDFDELPSMWMDHEAILKRAQQRLMNDIHHEQMTYNLLPEEFTMPELHQLHQVILKEKIDRSRFQKRMLATDLFERLPRLQKRAPGSNPYQYRVKK